MQPLIPHKWLRGIPAAPEDLSSGLLYNIALNFVNCTSSKPVKGNAEKVENNSYQIYMYTTVVTTNLHFFLSLV